MSDIEYLAGLFDAEGCINFPTPKIRKGKSSLGYANWTTRAEIRMKCKEVLEEFQKRWGGKIKYYSQKNNVCPLKSGENRTIYDWCLHGQTAKEFLCDIIPHLVFKQKSAQFLLELLEWGKKTTRDGTDPNKKLDLLLEHRANFLETRHPYVYDLSELQDKNVEYFAGLIDGDGMIKVYPPNSRIHARMKVEFVQTDKPIVEEFKRRWGGWIYEHGRAKPHHKTRWSWRTHMDRRTLQFLKDMKPHLIEKRDNVDEAISYLERSLEKRGI